MEKAFVSWSGGKDCCQAAYLAMKQGFDLRYLVNMVTQDGKRSCSHGISAKWIKLQSEAMGISIIQQPTTGDNYETVFSNTLLKLRSEGITTGVFGDIDFEPHREWIEKMCSKADIKPILPLWKRDQSQVARDLFSLGFVSIVVAAQTDFLSSDWLGRTFNTSFLNDLLLCEKEVTPCGEAGEFHTLVVDGPIFKKRIEIQKAEKVRRENHWFLDIKRCDLMEKG